MLLRILVCVLLLSFAASVDDEFIFNGFRDANLSLDGLAKITTDGLLMLTNTTKHTKAHAFYPAPLRFKRSPDGNVLSFSTTFVFAIVPEHPTIGAAGFTFVLSPSRDFSSALPNQFFGLVNLKDNGKPSNHIFAVEFDTVFDIEINDINDNHVGIDINGINSSLSKNAGYFSKENGEIENLRLINGEPMQFWLDYDGTDMQLNVTLSPLNVSKPILPLMSYSIDLSRIILDSMYVGFTAATDTIYSYHLILGWSFNINGKAQALDLSSLPSVPKTLISSKEKTRTLTIWLPISATLLVLMILACATFIRIRKKKLEELVEDWELDFGPQRFSYRDLYKATKGFKNKHLLGVGGFGRVYRGLLISSKLEVAVKRVSHGSSQGVKEFVAEMVSLGRLRHRNLVQLLGYCRRKGELLLVYDFMPNGSLDKFLFNKAKPPLTWHQRFHIIRGVASGLLYLHEGWEQVVIHRDVKASNVLLDGDMNGKLGDFGLARLYDHETDTQTTHMVGSMGYLAPELASTGKATTCTDVYAFGVFLLEVACGRRPLEPSKGENEQILLQWVFGNWERRVILETRDPRLGDEFAVEELEMVLKLGLLCSHPLPSVRPGMRQVVQFLDGHIPLPAMPHLFAAASPAWIASSPYTDLIISYPTLMSAATVEP